MSAHTSDKQNNKNKQPVHSPSSAFIDDANILTNNKSDTKSRSFSQKIEQQENENWENTVDDTSELEDDLKNDDTKKSDQTKKENDKDMNEDIKNTQERNSQSNEPLSEDITDDQERNLKIELQNLDAENSNVVTIKNAIRSLVTKSDPSK